MNSNRILGSIARLVRGQWLGLLALVLVLSGGAAYAAVAKDSVVSKSIKNGQVKTVDLKDGAVTGAKVLDDTLTGDDIDESTLNVTVADASKLGGLSASSYARSAVYKTEAATDAGTALGDGTFTKAMACDAGDILLSGGPASVASTSDMVESFPTPGSTNSWSARIDKNGAADNFTVVILCLDQA
jgi:hypothetical protein